MHPFKRGPWTDEECQTLIELVAKLGKKWSVIQNKMQRSADSCRDKYREYSDEFIKGRWKDEEADMLQLVVREHLQVDHSVPLRTLGKMVRDQNIQIPWSVVSKKMNRRSRLSCFKKWQKMTGDTSDTAKRPPPQTEHFDDIDVEPVSLDTNKRMKMFQIYEEDEVDNDMYHARMADETVAAVGLPDTDTLDV